ncbi:MAG TPA: glycosyltransferase [Thermoplasmatales archaeon]|nr:glycosyltransferase [Thermoplasmatales archaeon]
MKVNIFTEAEMLKLRTTGIVTSYRGLKRALEEEGVEVAVNEKKGYDILHVHSFGPISLVRMIPEKKPVVVTTHTVPDEMGLLYRGGVYVQGLFEKYLGFVYSQADLLISPSLFAKERVQRMGVKSRIMVESNGIHTEKFSRSLEKRKQMRDSLGFSDDDFVVGCVGLPSKRKGLDVFVEVAKRLPELRFMWVGENIYGRLLKDYGYLEWLKKNLPENVVLTGYVDDIQAAYSSMDLFLFPTMIETEGLVVLEAACCGLPLVTSRVRGLSWLNEGEHCLKAESVEEYVEVVRLLMKDDVERKRLTSNAKKLAEEKDIRRVVKRIIGLYEELLNG